VKKTGIIFVIASVILFSTSANSFYNGNNMPMIKMMSVMMELMSHMMLGGSSNNNYPVYPISPVSGMTAFPMSPANPLASVYGNNTAINSAINSNPWLNAAATENSFSAKNVQQQNTNTNTNTTQSSNNTMNGIWQALSGDVIAIYYNSKFIWTNGKERHLAGSLVIKDSQLTAYISSNKKVIKFKFYREGNKFAVKDNSGQIYIFTRIH
jgi:hypothetical protein